MNFHSKNLNLIEHFLDETSPESEQDAFKKRLEEDTDLHKLFIFRKKIQELLIQARQLEASRSFVRNSLKKQRIKNRSRIRYSIAAGILIILGLGGTIQIFNRKEQKNNSSFYSAIKTDSVQYPASQIKEYPPGKTGGCYEAPQVYSLRDTIELSFSSLDQKIHRARLYIIKTPNQDTLVNTIIDPARGFYRIYPGRLPVGQYKWVLPETRLHGKFTVRENK